MYAEAWVQTTHFQEISLGDLFHGESTSGLSGQKQILLSASCSQIKCSLWTPCATSDDT